LWHRFLEVEVPEQPFPRKNSREEFKRNRRVGIVAKQAMPMVVALAVACGLWLGVQRIRAKR
jgi:hypothetical protein